jgi:hypothetical protein
LTPTNNRRSSDTKCSALRLTMGYLNIYMYCEL